jgi:hypothetical protein
VNIHSEESNGCSLPDVFDAQMTFDASNRVYQNAVYQALLSSAAAGTDAVTVEPRRQPMERRMWSLGDASPGTTAK